MIGDKTNIWISILLNIYIAKLEIAIEWVSLSLYIYIYIFHIYLSRRLSKTEKLPQYKKNLGRLWLIPKLIKVFQNSVHVFWVQQKISYKD